MQVKHGWLIGPGDKVLSCDANGIVTFASSDLADADLLELAPIEGDRRGTFTPIEHLDILISADATAFTPGGNVCQQVYGAKRSEVVGPDGKPGWYQRWSVGQWDDGIVTALVPYIEQGADHGRNWSSAGLTWVEKA